MKIKRLILGLTLAVSLVACDKEAFSSLIDRGGGLIYDDDLDITWLQDARYIVTSGYSADPNVTFSQARSWTGGLEYFDSVRNIALDDWRLPTGGAGDYGPNDSELSHLFYIGLGNKGYKAPDGTYPQPGWGLSNTGPFVNVDTQWYWMDSSSFNYDAGLYNFDLGTGGHASLEHSMAVYR